MLPSAAGEMPQERQVKGYWLKVHFLIIIIIFFINSSVIIVGFARYVDPRRADSLLLGALCDA